jgi:hypothetical protein
MLELKGEYYVEANLMVPGNSDKKPRRPLLLLSSSVTANQQSNTWMSSSVTVKLETSVKGW